MTQKKFSNTRCHGKLVRTEPGSLTCQRCGKTTALDAKSTNCQKMRERVDGRPLTAKEVDAKRR